MGSGQSSFEEEDFIVRPTPAILYTDKLLRQRGSIYAAREPTKYEAPPPSTEAAVSDDDYLNSGGVDTGMLKYNDINTPDGSGGVGSSTTPRKLAAEAAPDEAGGAVGGAPASGDRPSVAAQMKQLGFGPRKRDPLFEPTMSNAMLQSIGEEQMFDYQALDDVDQERKEKNKREGIEIEDSAALLEAAQLEEEKLLGKIAETKKKLAAENLRERRDHPCKVQEVLVRGCFEVQAKGGDMLKCDQYVEEWNQCCAAVA